VGFKSIDTLRAICSYCPAGLVRRRPTHAVKAQGDALIPMLNPIYRAMPQSAGDVLVTRPRVGSLALFVGGNGSTNSLRPDAPAEGSTG